MATSTSVAFDEFKGKLLLTEPQNVLVRSRRETCAGYLSTAFPVSSDLPLNFTKLIGSAGRSTIIRPLDDIDVLAVFTNKDNVFERYRHNSQAFLYRIRDALNEYQVQVVGARGQAVRLFYANAPHVDIAPVFSWNSGGYALPDGTGGWLTTDPDVHETYMHQRNQDLGNRLKPMVRMLKRWNNEHGKNFKSFHLEALVAGAFSTLGNNSREASEVFFGCAASNVSVLDPAGYGGDLSGYLSWTARQDLQNGLRSAHTRARNAIAAENQGDQREAIRLWRIVFGAEFPAYG